MGDVIHLPRGRSEDALFDEVRAIVRASWAGAVSREQAERDADAVLRCWARIQRRAQGMAHA